MSTMPDYGYPGSPNLDPYYMSEDQIAEWEKSERVRLLIEADEEAERLADEAYCRRLDDEELL